MIGPPEGVTDGVGEKADVGVGVIVGVAVGVALGVLVGVLVAMLDGVAVGVELGVAVGVRVGVLVADAVGVLDGVLVGAAPVGVAVGAGPPPARNAAICARQVLLLWVNVVPLSEPLPTRSAEPKVPLPPEEPATKFCSTVKALLTAVTLSDASITIPASSRSFAADVATLPVKETSDPAPLAPVAPSRVAVPAMPLYSNSWMAMVVFEPVRASRTVCASDAPAIL